MSSRWQHYMAKLLREAGLGHARLQINQWQTKIAGWPWCWRSRALHGDHGAAAMGRSYDSWGGRRPEHPSELRARSWWEISVGLICRMRKQWFRKAECLPKATQGGQAGWEWNEGGHTRDPILLPLQESHKQEGDMGRGGDTRTILLFSGESVARAKGVMVSRDTAAGTMPGRPICSAPGLSSPQHRPPGTRLCSVRPAGPACGTGARQREPGLPILTASAFQKPSASAPLASPHTQRSQGSPALPRTPSPHSH